MAESWISLGPRGRILKEVDPLLYEFLLKKLHCIGVRERRRRGRARPKLL